MGYDWSWTTDWKTVGIAFLVLSMGGPSGVMLFSPPDPVYAASPVSSQPSKAKINRLGPGAKNGKVTQMSQTAVEIDEVSYSLAPNVLIETQTGGSLPVATSWSNLLRYPHQVRYWVTDNQITQMILTVPE